MSIYGYFNCHDCRQTIWLGKALHNDHRPFAFQRGTGPKHWNQPQFNKVIWKFLADHTGHHIDVRTEDQMTEEIYGYQEIGGDTGNDIAEEQYLKTLIGWYESD